jgi:hypothetical protein
MTTLQSINLGQYANDGTGDDLRQAFEKVNANFAALNTGIGVNNGTNIGLGVGIFAGKNISTLQFKSLTSSNASVSITPHPTTVDITALTTLNSDPHPTLSADLNLNGHVVYGGDIETTVYGINLPITNGILELLLVGNSFNIDLGSIPYPAGWNGNPGNAGINLDLGDFLHPLPNNNLDFGTIV